MSVQEIISMEYENLKKARNSRTLKNEFNEMTNQELYEYVLAKWSTEAGGAA